jgi:multicomponent K+:H+ antiporter subunit G
MTGAAEAPALAVIVTAILVLAGAAITLVGTLGLLRLRSFYQRAHATTLGTTLGTACIAVASMVYFTTLSGRPVLHELLILVFAIVTTPVTLMVLVHAARFRDRFGDYSRFIAGQAAQPEDPRPASAEPPP